MNNKDMPLAHSEKEGIGRQLFPAHTSGVYFRTLETLEEKKRYIDSELYAFMRNVLQWAVLYHDLGKLEENTQQFLDGKIKVDKMLNHCDAGTAYLLQKYEETKSNCFFFAALLVNSHHLGLVDMSNVYNYRTMSLKPNALRDLRILCEAYPQFKIKKTIADYINNALPSYLKIFHSIVNIRVDEHLHYIKPITPDTVRIILSILVHSDHSDTASNYKNAVPDKVHLMKIDRRMYLLDGYASNLGGGEEKLKIRKMVYVSCKNSKVFDSFAYCCSEVGNGKTLGVTRHSLNLIKKFDLSRLFWISPTTITVGQTARVLKKSLVEKDEEKDEVVAENHCKVEYEGDMARIYASTWSSLFVSTTAVQFFESLACARTRGLRKLHNIIGSVLVVDEFDKCMPIKQWKLCLKHLKELTEKWGCKVRFVSGSTVKLWEIQELTTPFKISSVIESSVSSLTLSKEKERVKPILQRGYVTPRSLIDLISLKDHVGPKLLVVNTIHNAALITKEIIQRKGKQYVEHLSTALAAIDRENILERVMKKLELQEDFVLVATSCVETGVDFQPSFMHGFRENSSLISLLQFLGRINRAYEYLLSKVVMFSFDPAYITKKNFMDGKFLTFNEELRLPSRILVDMYHNNKASPEYCTEAVLRELREKNNMDEINDLIKRENRLDFEYVHKKFNIINSNSVPIVVSPALIEKIQSGKRASKIEFSRGTVSISQSKLDKLRDHNIVPKCIFEDEKDRILAWDGEYDGECLGYMSEILKKILK